MRKYEEARQTPSFDCVPGASPLTFTYLGLLVYRMDVDTLNELAYRLRFSHTVEVDLHSLIELRAAGQQLGSAARASAIYQYLHLHSLNALWAARVATDDPRVRANIDRFVHELRDVKPSIGGAFLRSLGLKSSPVFGRILHALRDAMLDGLVHTREEEEAFVRDLVESGTFVE
jgi:tRNA nucleotidyltransferase (CCA-adding enzyme)